MMRISKAILLPLAFVTKTWSQSLLQSSVLSARPVARMMADKLGERRASTMGKIEDNGLTGKTVAREGVAVKPIEEIRSNLKGKGKEEEADSELLEEDEEEFDEEELELMGEFANQRKKYVPTRLHI